MAGINLAGSTKNLDASLNTIISEFRLQSEEGGTLKPLARNFKLEPHSGVSKIVLNYATFTAYSLTEGVDMAQAQQLADTQTTYTPAEVGLQVVMSDRTLSRVADPQLLARTGKIMASAYIRKLDSDGTAKATSFTTAALGAAGTVLGVGHILGGIQGLRTGNSTATPEPAPDPIYGAFHPNSLTAVLARLIPLGSTATGGTFAGTADGATTNPGKGVPGDSNALGQEILRRGRKALGTLFGVGIYDDANFTVDANNDATGMIFSKEGLIHVSEIESNEERERDASLRATEINLVGSYVWGVYRAAAYGIPVTSDASRQVA